jgi:hypothetical protein
VDAYLFKLEHIILVVIDSLFEFLVDFMIKGVVIGKRNDVLGREVLGKEFNLNTLVKLIFIPVEFDNKFSDDLLQTHCELKVVVVVLVILLKVFVDLLDDVFCWDGGVDRGVGIGFISAVIFQSVFSHFIYFEVFVKSSQTHELFLGVVSVFKEEPIKGVHCF